MASKICRVLVVEDDEGIQELLGDTLSSEGYRFASARGPSEMRRVLAAGDIDIVVIDIMLPGKETGIELAHEVAAQGYGVILVTGHPAHIAAMKISGHRFLQKPFRLTSLLDLVDQVLRETRAKCKVRRRRFRAVG